MTRRRSWSLFPLLQNCLALDLEKWWGNFAGSRGTVGSAIIPPQHEPEISDDARELSQPLVYYTNLQRLMVADTLLPPTLTQSSVMANPKWKQYRVLGIIAPAKLTWHSANLPQIWITHNPSLKSGRMKGASKENPRKCHKKYTMHFFL